MQAEPKILVKKAMRLYLRGKEIGSADVEVDLTNVPEKLHPIALQVATQMRHVLHLAALEPEPPRASDTPKEGWWKKARRFLGVSRE